MPSRAQPQQAEEPNPTPIKVIVSIYVPRDGWCVGVCLLPGTELAFDAGLKCERRLGSAPHLPAGRSS